MQVAVHRQAYTLRLNFWSLLVFLFCVIFFFIVFFGSNLEISRKFAPVVFACEKKEANKSKTKVALVANTR